MKFEISLLLKPLSAFYHILILLLVLVQFKLLVILDQLVMMVESTTLYRKH